ncbi:MAG: hypothetical protein P8Y71_12890 [Pseudolabrys sp.]
MAQLGASITDDYSAAGYGSIFISSDAAMNAVLSETKYTTTAYSDFNIVYNYATDPHYCAGCNGSFTLHFKTTSVGNASGVFGVGLNFMNSGSSVPYFPFVTFGDGTTLNLALPTTPCPYRKLDPDVLMVQPPNHTLSFDTPVTLNGPAIRRILP